MPKIKYTGPYASVRISHPVLQGQTVFARNVDTEVNESDAEALLKQEGFTTVVPPAAPQGATKKSKG